MHDRSGKANGMKPFAERSDIDLLGDAQSVFKREAQVSHRAAHLGLTQQKLNGAKVASLAVDLHRLGASQRMCAVSARVQTDRGYPVPDKPCILPRRNMRSVVETAWKKRKAQPRISGEQTQFQIESRVFSNT